MIGLIHTTCGFLALILGATVLLNNKATPFHRRVGMSYCVVMLLLNVSAFAIYHLTGHFNLFHVFAIVSLVTILLGLIPVLLRKHFPNWLSTHYKYMGWSYAGLLAATSNELFAHVTAFKQLIRIAGLWVPPLAALLILTVSGVIITRRQKTMLARYGGVTAGRNASETTLS